jgi:hypothetical protein
MDGDLRTCRRGVLAGIAVLGLLTACSYGVVTINVYAQGPRRSGDAELTATGEVVGVHVS